MKWLQELQNHCVTVLLIVLMGMILSGCESRPDCETVAATVTAVVKATESAGPEDLESLEKRWASGVHSETYIEGTSGANSSCARCHAPMAWQPLHDELPASWVTENLKGLTLERMIDETGWPQIGCEVCHPEGTEERDGEIAFLEIPILGIYEPVYSSTQLCYRCHLSDAETEHVPLQFGGVHQELDCTACHDAHDGTATCGESLCHQPFADECIPIETHDKPHADITCWGCHDGTDLPIGWNDRRQQWDTFLGGDPRYNPDSFAYVSHSLELVVDCDRCHAPGDHPWDAVP